MNPFYETWELPTAYLDSWSWRNIPTHTWKESRFSIVQEIAGWLWSCVICLVPYHKLLGLKHDYFFRIITCTYHLVLNAGLTTIIYKIQEDKCFTFLHLALNGRVNNEMFIKWAEKISVSSFVKGKIIFNEMLIYTISPWSTMSVGKTAWYLSL